MRSDRLFEKLVKDHFDKGADIHTAFGKAIEEDPEAYGEYLKREKGTTIDRRREPCRQ
jgi:translation initiation factor 2 beta subunit (eIF-2beta)/eIF-5